MIRELQNLTRFLKKQKCISVKKWCTHARTHTHTQTHTHTHTHTHTLTHLHTHSKRDTQKMLRAHKESSASTTARDNAQTTFSPCLLYLTAVVLKHCSFIWFRGNHLILSDLGKYVFHLLLNKIKWSCPL